MPTSRLTMKRPIRPPSPRARRCPACASSRTFDFGSSASRRPSPKTFSESTVSRIIVPGMIVSSGALVSRSKPVAIIVPQEELGGCTPTPRKESAASSSMSLAMLRVKKTMIVDAEVGQQLAEHHPQRAGALGDRGLDELLLAQGEHLAADRPRHVGDEDEADDQDRDPDRAAGEMRAGRSAGRRRRARCPSAIASSSHREGPDHVHRPRDHARRSSRGSSRRAGRGAIASRVVISAAAKPMSSEVRPPYISRTISSRPRRPSAPRKNLPPAPNQTRPDRLAFGVDDFALFAVDFDLLQRVRRRSGRCGRRRRPRAARRGRRRRSGRRGRGRRAPPGCAAGAARRCARDRGRRGGTSRHWARRPPPYSDAAPGGYLNWKLVRSCPKVGLKMTCRGRFRWRRRSRRVGRRRGPTAPVPCIPCRAAAYSASCLGPSGSSPSLAIFAFSSGIVDLGEVGVVGRRDAFAGQQRLEEVVRVRVVLEPVGPAGVEVGRRFRCRSP